MIERNNKITPNKTNDNSKWEYFLINICFSELYLLKSIISTQNDVVREVRAESAEEYAAAIIPIINQMPTYSGSPEFKAILGNNISASDGIAKPISEE